MKKILFAIVILLAFMLPIRVLAADPEPEEPEVAEQEAEPTLEDFKAEVQAWMSQYMEESMVVKIVTWLVDAGVLSALLAVYIRYRKYKHTTIEDLLNQFKEKMGEWLKEKTDELSTEQIDKIKKAIEDLEKSNEVVMKVLVLMQDNTAKGKAALIEYLGSKTESAEIKEAAAEVNEALEEQAKKTEEVNSKVAGEYEEIF